ncbi:MAG: sigma 54-interacting transcriptional regulator [Pyrinomonadaceae bacterium]|nr:sigma 54-interacting transcriptional regulator [Pyrinomonadaceae bacterium]
MTLDVQSSSRSSDSSPSLTNRARLSCVQSKGLEEAGNYEAARSALGEFWRHVGERPNIELLDRGTAAEVLLRVGTLSGWIGSSQQIGGSQETAKNLITESAHVFESLGEKAKAAEAQVELAWCYWREGAYAEARVMLREALGRLTDSDGDLKGLALVRAADVERADAKLNDALQILNGAAALVESSSSHSLKGKFHNTLAVVLKNLGATERRADYIDRALVEFAAASFHFEQAGHTRFLARVENNLGFLFLKLDRFQEAHQHLDRARLLFNSFKDAGSIAQVDETRARSFLAQGQNFEAERIVRASVHTLEKGGEQALLVESLTTHGVALARLNRFEQAQSALTRAVETGEGVGDYQGAGRAAVTLIEELGEHLAPNDLRETYLRADELLHRAQDVETIARLRVCARRVVEDKKARVAENTRSVFIHAAEETAKMLDYARQVALSDTAMLLTGETGTGKEVLARLIHEWSGRGGNFVAINCAALCDSLVESQLFGHTKGSFTDAERDHPGAVREAAGGTLLLDEIAELSRANQAKLLRMIEEGEVHALGASSPERIDVRIVAATNRNLAEEVACGNLRADLLYRLNAFHIHIPPLRERTADIPVIARKFIHDFSEHYAKPVSFTPESVEAMRDLPLPGNARELRALIERAWLTAAEGAIISAEDVQIVALRQMQQAGFTNPWAGCSLEGEVLQYEKRLIKLALDAAHGRITHAARLLGITHQGLAFILNGRHKDLLGARKPARRVYRSIMNKRQKETSKERSRARNKNKA